VSGGNRVVSRVRWAVLTAAVATCGALFLLVLLSTMPRATLAAPSQSLQHGARQLQSAESHPALTPTAVPQPTKIDLSQPTAGPSVAATPPASSSLGSNGLTIAVALSCLTFILGLTVGGSALIILLRGGYGPFLRTLLPGGRTSRRARQYGPNRSPSPRRPAPTARRR